MDFLQMSYAIQDEIDALADILRDAQKQMIEIENLQKNISFTLTKECNKEISNEKVSE